MFDYETRTDDDLSFKRNETLEIFDFGDNKNVNCNSGKIQGDWWYARRVKTNQVGYIPSNYIAYDKSIDAQP